MCLVMVVKAFSFLMAISIQQGRIKVKKYRFRIIDRLNDLTHFSVDIVKLDKRIFIHSVPESG